MDTTEFNNISFDLPKNQSNVIKVIGVGGGGSNAVNHMFSQGIKGVDFVICNTDAQAIQNSPVPVKIQLGISLTEGLGAGANPEVGEQAAIESTEEIKNMLTSNTKMVFITAGMGGGTGTGAAPVIAKIAKELNLLTIGIVTIPFSFEGKTRNDQAQIGLEKIREHVDSLVIINNNKLREVYGNLGFKAGFSKADEVLSTAARGIAEVITHHYTQNIDLKDAKTVLSNSGTAIMGSSTAEGANRANEAIMKALDSPLLNDNKITGAKNVLLLIVSGVQEITIDEIGEINDYIQSEAKSNVNIIMGVGDDDSLGNSIAVTIIATGFTKDQQHEISNTEAKKIVHTLEEEQKIVYNFSSLKADPENDSLDIKSLQDINKPISSSIESTDKIIYNLESEPEELGTTSINSKVKEIIVTDFENLSPVSTTIIPEKSSEFVIKEVSLNQKLSDEQPLVDDPQISISFDQRKTNPELALPTMKSDKQPDINIDDIEVVDYAIIRSTSPTLTKKYYLEDYEQESDSLTVQSEATIEEVPHQEVEDLEIGFEIKIKEDLEEGKELTPAVTDDASPLNLSIDELKMTTEDRKRRLKEFNYKFINKVNSNIDELEKQPAYKRMGVDLEDTPHSSEVTTSRTTLNVDENNEIQLRSNNSFLHDNVD